MRDTDKDIWAAIKDSMMLAGKNKEAIDALRKETNSKFSNLHSELGQFQVK